MSLTWLRGLFDKPRAAPVNHPARHADKTGWGGRGWKGEELRVKLKVGGGGEETETDRQTETETEVKFRFELEKFISQGLWYRFSQNLSNN